MQAAGIQYEHAPALGGRRTPAKDSKNTNWKNAGFRGYADHMASAEFEQGIEKLTKLATAKRTTVMCAEALWWRCHRSLIADFFKAAGWEVVHIVDARKTESHPFTAAARILDGELSYEGMI